MATVFARSHHLDRRAAALAQSIEADGDPHDLLTTIALINRLGVSRKWLDSASLCGFGPPFAKIGVMRTYRRDAVVAWLRDRENHFATSHAEPECAPRPTLITA